MDDAAAEDVTARSAAQRCGRSLSGHPASPGTAKEARSELGLGLTVAEQREIGGEERERRRPRALAEWFSDTSRAEAFSDGVMAVALTLLVLNLAAPPHQPGGLFNALVDLWPAYVAFLASYAFVGVAWTNHHVAFRRIRVLDRGLSWANLGILLTTVLIPFPTAVLANAFRDGNSVDSRTAVSLYALIGTLAAISWLVFFHYLRGHPELLRHENDAAYFHNERRRAVAGIIPYSLAGALGYFINPLIALVIFVLLPTFYALTSEGLRGSHASSGGQPRDGAAR